MALRHSLNINGRLFRKPFALDILSALNDGGGGGHVYLQVLARGRFFRKHRSQTCDLLSELGVATALTQLPGDSFQEGQPSNRINTSTSLMHVVRTQENRNHVITWPLLLKTSPRQIKAPTGNGLTQTVSYSA